MIHKLHTVQNNNKCPHLSRDLLGLLQLIHHPCHDLNTPCETSLHLRTQYHHNNHAKRKGTESSITISASESTYSSSRVTITSCAFSTSTCPDRMTCELTATIVYWIPCRPPPHGFAEEDSDITRHMLRNGVGVGNNDHSGATTALTPENGEYWRIVVGRRSVRDLVEITT